MIKEWLEELFGQTHFHHSVNEILTEINIKHCAPVLVQFILTPYSLSYSLFFLPGFLTDFCLRWYDKSFTGK